MMIQDAGRFNGVIYSRPYGANTLSRAWKPNWSNDLQRTVKWLCDPDPDARPTLDRLQQHINSVMAQPEFHAINAHRNPVDPPPAILPWTDWGNEEF